MLEHIVVVVAIVAVVYLALRHNPKLVAIEAEVKAAETSTVAEVKTLVARLKAVL
jgi:hypothetical protein